VPKPSNWKLTFLNALLNCKSAIDTDIIYEFRDFIEVRPLFVGFTVLSKAD
jgi:hypothetical protein